MPKPGAPRPGSWDASSASWKLPREHALPADELRSAKQCVLAGLGDERAEFEQSQEAVAEKLSRARAAFVELRDKRVAEGMTKQEAVAKQLKLIDETETNVDYDTEKVKVNTKTEVERFNRSIESLQKWLTAAQYRLNVVRIALVNNEEKLYQQALSSQQTATGVTTGRNSLVRQALNYNQIKGLVLRLGAEQNHAYPASQTIDRATAKRPLPSAMRCSIKANGPPRS